MPNVNCGDFCGDSNTGPDFDCFIINGIKRFGVADIFEAGGDESKSENRRNITKIKVSLNLFLGSNAIITVRHNQNITHLLSQMLI